MKIEVRYLLEKPEMEFLCPFCDTKQSEAGGHRRMDRFYPSPDYVVEHHLWGEKGCPKFHGSGADLHYEVYGRAA